MKSFFKKLSLVLAAAMIITLIPAQQTKAADAKVITYAKQDEKEAIKDGVLTLKVGATQDVKFLGCSDYKKTGSKVNGGWSSDLDAVATVDKKGVITAVAAGIAKIAYNATGYTGTLTVIVEADSYNVTLNDQKDKTKVVSGTTYEFKKIGDEYDVCFIGATGFKSSKYVCQYQSSNEDVATVNKDGLITAKGAGEAVISLTITEKTTGKAANWAVKPLTVKVPGTQKLTATLKAYNKVEVKLGDKAPESVQVFQVADNGEARVEVSYDAKNGVITFYNAPEVGTKWVIKSGDASADLTINFGAVDHFTVSYSSKASLSAAEAENNAAYVGTPISLKAEKFVDKNGTEVDVTKYTKKFTYKEFVNGVESDEIVLDSTNPTVWMSTVGQIYNVTVYLLDSKGEQVCAPAKATLTGKAIPALEIVAPVTIKVGELNKNLDNSKVTKITVDDAANFGLNISFKDTRGVEYKTFTAGNISSTITAAGELASLGYFEFKSYDPSILGVTESGVLEARNAGSTTVEVYFNYRNSDGTVTSKLIGSQYFTVLSTRVPVSVVPADGAKSDMITIGRNSATISDYAGNVPGKAFNKVVFKYTVTDDKQDDITKNGALAAEVVPADTSLFTTATASNGELTLVANDIATADVPVKSTYVTLKVTKGGVTKQTIFNVSIVNYNYQKSTTDKYTVADQPALVRIDSVSGLGNTDNCTKAANEDINLQVALVEVRIVGGQMVYGDLVTTPVANYKTIETMTADQLKNQRTASGDIYYLAVYDNNTLLDATNYAAKVAASTATPGVYSIKVRDSFDTIKGTRAATAAAQTIANLPAKNIRVDVYRIFGENTKVLCTLYDKVSTITLTNKDAANYAASVTLKTTVFEGTVVPTGSSLVSWVQANSDIYAKKYTTVKQDGEIKAYTGVQNFEVHSLGGSGSRYIDYVDFYIEIGNTGILTYVKCPINRSLSPKR